MKEQEDWRIIKNYRKLSIIQKKNIDIIDSPKSLIVSIILSICHLTLTRELAGNKNQQILLQKSSSFYVPVKTNRLSCKNRMSSLENPLNFPVKVGGFSSKDCQLFLQKSSHFLAKRIKSPLKNC